MFDIFDVPILCPNPFFVRTILKIVKMFHLKFIVI